MAPRPEAEFLLTNLTKEKWVIKKKKKKLHRTNVRLLLEVWTAVKTRAGLGFRVCYLLCLNPF